MPRRSVFDQLKLNTQLSVTLNKGFDVREASEPGPDRDAKIDALVHSYFDLAVAAGVDRAPWFIDYEMGHHFSKVRPPEKARRIIIAEVAAARKRAAR